MAQAGAVVPEEELLKSPLTDVFDSVPIAVLLLEEVMGRLEVQVKTVPQVLPDYRAITPAHRLVMVCLEGKAELAGMEAVVEMAVEVEWAEVVPVE